MTEYEAAPDLLPQFEVFTDRSGAFGIVYQLIDTSSVPSVLHDTFCPWNGDPLPSWLRVRKPWHVRDTPYPEIPEPGDAFDQYAAAWHAGKDYTHLHPCVQQAIESVYEENTGNNYLSPSAFTRHYDDYWFKVWLSNIGARHKMCERFPMLPSTWETRERT